jgi:dynactin complex subunit
MTTEVISLNGRVSYGGSLCTIRYIGPIEGKDPSIIWYGVEWDDPSRGKHDGSHKGKRYFTCKNPSGTSASFVRSSRKPDLRRSFIQAVKEKYAGEAQPSDPNVISGKVVEEVGFEKIQDQQRRLHELKIVVVDGSQIEAAEDDGDEAIETMCPSIVELDISRNIFPFVKMCKIIRPDKLSNLKKLKFKYVCLLRSHLG